MQLFSRVKFYFLKSFIFYAILFPISAKANLYIAPLKVKESIGKIAVSNTGGEPLRIVVNIYPAETNADNR